MDKITEKRTLEDIHYDVGLANSYRIEYIKHLMSLSAGIFVVSIAFMSDLVKDIENSEYKIIIILSWWQIL